MLNFDQALELTLDRINRPITEARILPEQDSTALDTPDVGQPFTYLNQAAVALPAVGAEITVVSFVVPNGRDGRIQALANQVVTGGWTEGTGDVVWRLEVNGVPQQGFGAIIASLGSVSRPGDFTVRPLRIREGDFVAFICRNVALVVGGSNPLLALIGGYYYAVGSENTWL